MAERRVQTMRTSAASGMYRRPAQSTQRYGSGRPAQGGAGRSYARRYMTYVDGNTVRKAAVAEPVRRREPQADPRKSARARTRRNRESAKRMTPGFVAFLAMASVAFFLICTQYLQAQALATSNASNIEALEEQLRELRTANNYHENEIEAMTDINHIYAVATGELGMVYPTQDQLISYDSSTSEYVRQSETLGR